MRIDGFSGTVLEGERKVIGVRRIWTVVILWIALMVLALPAWAQEVPPEGGGGQAINAVVTVSFLALVIQYMIEWVRGRFAGIDADLVRLVALVLGFGASWMWDLNVAADFGFMGLPTMLSYLVAAFVIAGLSGFLASAKNGLRSKDPQSSMYPPVSLGAPADGGITMYPPPPDVSVTPPAHTEPGDNY